MKAKNKRAYNQKRKDFLLFALLISIQFIIANQLLVYAHEEVHQAIYKGYGIDSKMHIGFLQGYVKPIVDNETMQIYLENYDTINTLHGVNEIFGYQIDLILVAISIYTVMLGALIILFK